MRSVPRGSWSAAAAFGMMLCGAASAFAQHSISGRVTEEGSGAPLEGVRVFAHTAGGQIISDDTDAAGDYSIPLADGTYYVRTWNVAGYIDEVHQDIPCVPCPSPGSQGLVVTGTPVQVGGAPVPGIDFALLMGGRISGAVVDEVTLGPIQGARVRLVDAAGATVAIVRTLADGTYSTSNGVSTGVYFAIADLAHGYLNEAFDEFPCTTGCNVFLSTSFTVTEGEIVEHIDFTLAAGGSIEGIVTDAMTGTPLSGANVSVNSLVGNFGAGAITNAAGVFVTPGLPTGDYVVRARNSPGTGTDTLGYIEEIYDDKPCPRTCPSPSGTPVHVEVGLTTSGINFALTPGGRIEGLVTDGSSPPQPLGGVGVQIFDASGRLFDAASSNDAGVYVSRAGLPSGTYYARTTNGFGYINETFGGGVCSAGCQVTTGDPIEVLSPNTTGGVNFVLSAGGRISGRVTDTGGSPLRAVSVNVFDAASRSVSGASTNALGEYTTTAGLLTDGYYVRASNGQGYINELYNDVQCLGSCDVTTGEVIPVTEGQTTSIADIDLEIGGRASGTVTLAGSGAPLPGVAVGVYDASGVRLAGGGTDGVGRFLTNGGLPSGDSYFLRTTNGQGLVNEVYDGIECTTGCDAPGGTAVSLAAGSITFGLDFELRSDDDADADGIAATIDLLPAAASDDFSDAWQPHGTTAGSITGRNGWTVSAIDLSSPGDVFPHPFSRIGNGVQLALSGAGAQAATADTCSTGGAERLIFDVAGETARFACEPATGSTAAVAVVASPALELREPPTGPGTIVSLATGQAAALGSPVTAGPGNTEPIGVSFVDADGVPFGSFELDPDESVDAQVNADGSVDVTVLDGIVTVEVRGEAATLEAGETFSSPGIADAIDALASLPPDTVTTKGSQTALGNLLKQALRALDTGDVTEARKKLQDALERTDGCALRGAPDPTGGGQIKQDYITTCTEQAPIHSILRTALDALGAP